jgi:tellurite methyltransferase
MNDPLPDGLVPANSSPIFTKDTIPDALQQEHALAPGHWGVLNILEGSLRFRNLETGEDHTISAPGRITIHPRMRHRVATDGPVRCRIDFFRDKRD